MCNCLTDEGRPLGTGLQERVPNHLRRLWSKAMVVSTEGKGLEEPGQVTSKKRTAREPLMTCRKRRTVAKTAGNRCCGTSFGSACLWTEAAPGIKVA